MAPLQQKMHYVDTMLGAKVARQPVRASQVRARFATQPCLGECPQLLEIVFLELETTGVSVVEDRIVEFADVQILPSSAFRRQFLWKLIS